MVSDPRHPIVGDLSGSRAAGIIFELGNRQSADPMDVRARSPGLPGRSVELTCTCCCPPLFEHVPMCHCDGSN